MAPRDPLDPKGLMTDAYLIAGITAGECRSIFLDWALGLESGADTQAAIRTVLERHKTEPADHPMTLTLQEGLKSATPPRRRGGRAGRLSS